MLGSRNKLLVTQPIHRRQRYPTVSEAVDLVAERETELDLKLQGNAAVTSEDFDGTHKPIAKAMVELTESEHRVLTGPRGEF